MALSLAPEVAGLALSVVEGIGYTCGHCIVFYIQTAGYVGGRGLAQVQRLGNTFRQLEPKAAKES